MLIKNVYHSPDITCAEAVLKMPTAQQLAMASMRLNENKLMLSECKELVDVIGVILVQILGHPDEEVNNKALTEIDGDTSGTIRAWIDRLRSLGDYKDSKSLILKAQKKELH